ncbi:MAG: hypothetical protein KAW19_03035, partial [Candidatus Aminicenantes bacterium]|nr:hypothetical protein [Candidatus Aminicenantes bacterium]
CDRLDVLDEKEVRTETTLLRLEGQPIAQEQKGEIRTSMSMSLVAMARERVEIRRALMDMLKEM